MHSRTKHGNRGGRPRKFEEEAALLCMQRQLWTSGLSGSSLDGIARSAGLNRPSLSAAFGDKEAIYARAASQYAAMMDERLSRSLDADDLTTALRSAFGTAIDIYTADGPDGCFVICTAPAEAPTNPVCRKILDEALIAIDALFLKRLEKEIGGREESRVDLSALASLLSSTLNGIALRARAGWGRDRLCSMAADTTTLVVAMLNQTATRNPSDTGR